MECKFEKQVLYSFTLPELIDTLWNVNEDVLAMINNRDKGINRYIMECKYAKARGTN